jgi:trans-aconitate 2-methyltransferase
MASAKDWNPGTYARFRGLRLRPAIDLLAQVPDLPPGDVVDLGCGDGAVAEALKSRFADRHLSGVDSSPAMLTAAGRLGLYDRLTEADAGTWTPGNPPALIFSNALLHWLPDHDTLLPRLAGLLTPGGCLAIQMPGQHDAPSHALLRSVAAALFPERFDFTDWRAAVAEPTHYHALLAPLGAVSVWETTYVQTLAAPLAPVETGHPVRRFTESTAARPILDRLDPDETARFLAAYDSALEAPYRRRPDGSALFPFRRLFIVLTRA